VAVHLPDYRHDRPGDSFRGWLRTITHNRVCNFFRSRAAEARAQGGTEAQQRLLQVPDPLAEHSDRGQQMEEETGLAHRALEMIRAEFEDRTWRAFCVTTMEGRSGLDVAAELGMSVQAVYKAKSRVLQRLRQEIAE
jgi:RNA polymerase sigma-70 factor (ECF subfamily)